MSLKHELQNIISGNGSVRNGKIIQTITGYLRGKKETIPDFKESKFSKSKETEILKEFITNSNLWYSKIDDSKYIGCMSSNQSEFFCTFLLGSIKIGFSKNYIYR